MLTYQVRPRHFKVSGSKTPEFPNEVEVNFYFLPLQPFGAMAGGGVTAVKAIGASLYFNLNSGQHSVESRAPLSPLNVTISEDNRTVTVHGNCFTVKQRCESLDKLGALVENLYYIYPIVLNVEFADPPYVERVDGRIGELPFSWELSGWAFECDLTTQQKQEQRIVSAWEHISVIASPKRRRFAADSPPIRRRFAAALHYFHVACRVKREANVPGEFLAEALLNFHKTLEILYGPDRDTVRKELQNLVYTFEEIERDYIPAMLLRNAVDVGHPMLTYFSSTQLETLHRYADRAERAFRDLLQRLFKVTEEGQLDVVPSESYDVDSKLEKTIEALRIRLDALGNQP